MTNLPRKAKMADLVNYRLRVVLLDGRQLTGQLLAFDKFMNLVLADTEEFRATKKSLAAAKKATSSSASSSESTHSVREIKRTLGLVILRGETIISVSVEAPPPNTDNAARLGASAAATAAAAGGNTSRTGTSRPINRSADGAGFGAPSTATALSGPARTTAASFFGGSSGPSGFGAPPGFQPPPGFGGR